MVHLANPLLPSGLSLPDGSGHISGDSLAVGYNLGVLVEIWPETRIGASYRSQIGHRLVATFNVPGALALSPGFQNAPARADLKTPDIVSIAISHQISPEITLLAESQWTNWAVVKNLRIERADGSALSDQSEQ